MKRSHNEERVLIQAKAETDIAGLINKIQEHLVSLEKKIDTLISRSSVQTNERYFGRPRQDDRGRQRSEFRERKLYEVICADCGRECEVPFKPGLGRPVYCKECFSIRKSGGGFRKEKHDKMPVARYENQESGRKKKQFHGKHKKR